ncbi:hypothetical protein [Symmachiella dynata]|nr:hypothetical protein [Symmachiella dynata]
MVPKIAMTASAQVMARSRWFLRDRDLWGAEEAAQATAEQHLPDFGS